MKPRSFKSLLCFIFIFNSSQKEYTYQLIAQFAMGRKSGRPYRGEPWPQAQKSKKESTKAANVEAENDSSQDDPKPKIEFSAKEVVRRYLECYGITRSRDEILSLMPYSTTGSANPQDKDISQVTAYRCLTASVLIRCSCHTE
jgi:hypothetical protein